MKLDDWVVLVGVGIYLIAFVVYNVVSLNKIRALKKTIREEIINGNKEND